MPGEASSPAPTGDGEGTEKGDKAGVVRFPTARPLAEHGLRAGRNTTSHISVRSLQHPSIPTGAELQFVPDPLHYASGFQRRL